MIKQIFVPQRIDSYYIFGKRIAAFDIGPTEIEVTVALLKGHRRIIENLFSERIETDSILSLDERTVQALKNAAKKIGNVDEIAYAVPSAHVVFKELSLPFTGMKKIKMVVPFEVESLLPFTLDSAVIDCIVTKEDTTGQVTDLLVAAVKKEQIEHDIALFASAGLPLQRISVDMFELYGLYKMIVPKNQELNSVALIDLGYYATRIALVIKGQLKYIRSVGKGLVSVAKKLATLNGIDTVENIHQLMRFGVAEVGSPPGASQALEELLAEIQLTIESYTKKLSLADQLNKIIITGPAADMPGLAPLVSTILQYETHVLLPKQLLHNSVMQSKITPLTNASMVSIATALTPEVTKDFNLQKSAVEQEENRIIQYQLITLGILISLIFLFFSLYSFLRVRNLRLASSAAQTEAIEELKKSFKLKPSQLINLQTANKAAFTELKKEESAWHRLSTENRYVFLRYLAELSRCIQVKDTQLSLTSMHLQEDTVKLYGSVPGYQQLTRLQNELECPLFKKPPKLQDWNFRSEPITLIVNKEE